MRVRALTLLWIVAGACVEEGESGESETTTTTASTSTSTSGGETSSSTSAATTDTTTTGSTGTTSSTTTETSDGTTTTGTTTTTGETGSTEDGTCGPVGPGDTGGTSEFGACVERTYYDCEMDSNCHLLEVLRLEGGTNCTSAEQLVMCVELQDDAGECDPHSMPDCGGVAIVAFDGDDPIVARTPCGALPEGFEPCFRAGESCAWDPTPCDCACDVQLSEIP